MGATDARSRRPTFIPESNCDASFVAPCQASPSTLFVVCHPCAMFFVLNIYIFTALRARGGRRLQPLTTRRRWFCQFPMLPLAFLEAVHSVLQLSRFYSKSHPMAQQPCAFPYGVGKGVSLGSSTAGMYSVSWGHSRAHMSFRSAVIMTL